MRNPLNIMKRKRELFTDQPKERKRRKVGTLYGDLKRAMYPGFSDLVIRPFARITPFVLESHIYGKLKFSDCKSIVAAHFNGESPPTLKRDMISWIVSHMNGKESPAQKRSIELENLKLGGPSGLDMCQVHVPKGLILLALSYLRDGPEMMSCSLVCSQMYLFCLESCRSVRFSFGKVYDVPILAVMSARRVSVNVTKRMYVSEMKHIIDRAARVETLELSGSFSKFVSTVTRVEGGMPCTILKVDEDRSYEREQTLFGESERSGMNPFPRLRELWAVASGVKFARGECFRTLTTIVLSDPALMARLDDDTCFDVPDFFKDLRCLKTLALCRAVTGNSWEIVSQMGIERLLVLACTRKYFDIARGAYARMKRLRSLIVSVRNVYRQFDRANLFAGTAGMPELRSVTLCACVERCSSANDLNILESIEALPAGMDRISLSITAPSKSKKYEDGVMRCLDEKLDIEKAARARSKRCGHFFTNDGRMVMDCLRFSELEERSERK